MRKQLALGMLVALVGAFAALLFSSQSALPERLATHFGANGMPNGWMTRNEFLSFGALVVLLPAGILLGVAALIGRIPPSLINVPNRTYWLAPERRAATVDRIRLSMFELCNGTLAFLIFVLWSVIDANKTGEPRLGGGFGVGLVAFLAFVALWSFLLVRPYLAVPPGSASTKA